MANELLIKAQEGSTFVIKADFIEKGSDGSETPIVPNVGLKWSLVDADGNIINSKNDVPLTPASSVNIVLSGNDLALTNNYPVKRFVTIEGTYDSLLGTNLPIVDEVSFQIENVSGV